MSEARPIQQLDVDLVYQDATGCPSASARLPIYLAPYNRRMPAGALPERPSLFRTARRLWRLVDRETRIALGFCLFAALSVLLVSIDAHSWAAAFFA